MNRREFLGCAAASAALAATAAGTAASKPAAKPRKARPEGFAWGILLHFGMNFWGEWDGEAAGAAPEDQFVKGDRAKALSALAKEKGPQRHLRFDYETWKAATEHMAKRGLNMALIDMGEAVVLPRRPELAASDSWSVERFRKELDRLRSLGLEPIPKFNFSACHDAWLKDYGHMMGDRKYYEVVADVIRDTVEIFDTPRFFHIGYEEEFGNKYERPDDLWWHDLGFIVGEVERLGVRAWAWTDYPAWRPRETFARKMPKSVLQSAWWYAEMKDLITCRDPRMFAKAGLFADLERMGFDQIPCGGNYCTDKNMAEIVRCGDAVVRDGRLKGYLTTTWRATLPDYRKAIFDAVDQLGDLI